VKSIRRRARGPLQSGAEPAFPRDRSNGDTHGPRCSRRAASSMLGRRANRAVVNPPNGVLHRPGRRTLMVLAPLLPTSRTHPIRDTENGGEGDVRSVTCQRHRERFQVLDMRGRRARHDLCRIVVDRDAEGRGDVRRPSAASGQRLAQAVLTCDPRPHGIGKLHGSCEDHRLHQPHHPRDNHFPQREIRARVCAAGTEQDDCAGTGPVDVPRRASGRRDEPDSHGSRGNTQACDVTLRSSSERGIQSRELRGKSCGKKNVRGRIGLRRVGSHAHAGKPL